MSRQYTRRYLGNGIAYGTCDECAIIVGINSNIFHQILYSWMKMNDFSISLVLSQTVHTIHTSVSVIMFILDTSLPVFAKLNYFPHRKFDNIQLFRSERYTTFSNVCLPCCAMETVRYWQRRIYSTNTGSFIVFHLLFTFLSPNMSNFEQYLQFIS